MSSVASRPATFPITTRGTALLHLNFLLTGIVMTFLGPMLPILASRWAMSDAVSGRLLAIEDGRLVSYAGGWAEYQRRGEPVPEAAPRRPPKAKPRARPKQQQKQSQSPLELVEREVERGEARVAELERQLAEDWTNVDLVAAHRAARDDLAALLARWESLFGS